MTNNLYIPEDIRTIDTFLGQIRAELTDVMAMEVREWRAELRAAVRDWKGGGSEPDWLGFREWLNDICHDDGMPALFPTSKEA